MYRIDCIHITNKSPGGPILNYSDVDIKAILFPFIIQIKMFSIPCIIWMFEIRMKFVCKTIYPKISFINV